MNLPASDSPLVVWPCYEPAGGCVELSEPDLVQHLLLIGSTGSGKSTLLTSALHQLIAHRSATRAEQCGLLILDAKTDDLVTRVSTMAAQAGRAEEVMVFGPHGHYALDLFGGLRSLEDVPRVTRSVLLGSEPMGRDNAYWQQATEAMLAAAFTLLVVGKQPLSFARTVEFLRSWLLAPVPSPGVEERLAALSRAPATRHPAVAAALDQAKLWAVLDPKTRSILQSCLLNVIRPLLSPAATRCFAGEHERIGCPAQAATEGRICVVTVNAMAEPELARFFFRLAKQSFFAAVQQRTGDGHRLCGVIADELPLIVTANDVEQFATLRSKRAFILAATQGLRAIAEQIGMGPTMALLNNCNTTVFLRSREAETALHAQVVLGTRRESRRPRLREGDSDLLPPPDPAPAEVPVCPLGALGRLSPHQAFVIRAEGSVTRWPVWFVPWFEQGQPALPAPATPPRFSAAYVSALMHGAGFRLHHAGDVVTHAYALCPRRRGLLQRTREFFHTQAVLIPAGLETLPDCWLAGLPGILGRWRKPHWHRLPFFITRIGIEAGVLLLEFAQEIPGDSQPSGWDHLRIALNAGLYPSCWRPLHRRLALQLRPRAAKPPTPPAVADQYLG